MNGDLLHARKAGIENALFVWDVVGISQRIGMNLLPGLWSESESQQITDRCYSQDTANVVTIGQCSFVYRTLVQAGDWRTDLLLPVWFKAVTTHLKEYLIIRLRFLRSLFWPNNIFVFDATDPAHSYGFQDNVMFDIMTDILIFCKSAPIIYLVFTLGFWMLVSGGLCLVFSFMTARRNAAYYRSFLLSLSAVAYVWPLLVIGVAGDLRYAYWSIVASCVALLIAGTGGLQAASSAGFRPEV